MRLALHLPGWDSSRETMQKGHAKLDPALQTEIVSQATEAVIVRVMAELRNSPAEVQKPKQDRRAA